MSAGRRATAGLVLATALLLLTPVQPARSAEPGAEVSSEDMRAQAVRLFGEGRARYEAGEYDGAVDAFTRAYALTPDPLLMFNVAQAHRRAGHCPQSLDGYERFLRLDPRSPRAGDATGYVRELSATCGAVRQAVTAPGPSVAKATVPPGPAPAGSEPATEVSAERKDAPGGPAPASTFSSRRGQIALLGAGLLLGGGALGVRTWNDTRFEDWRREDQLLLDSERSMAEPEVFLIARQNQNDAQLRSIRTTDTVAGVVGIAAGAAVIGALVWLLLDLDK